MRERGAGFYHGLAIAAVVIWGTTFVSTKVLLTGGLSPAASMFLRCLIALKARKRTDQCDAAAFEIVCIIKAVRIAG